MKEPLKSLLIIDDDPETARLLRRALPEDSWQIADTVDPECAPAMLREKQSDVTLLNLDLAKGSGVSLLWLLRQVRPRTRVILITPAITSIDIIQAIRAHVFSYFSKPFEVEPVVEMIARAAAAVDWEDGIEVLSARSGWISLRLRCRQLTADRLVQFFRELKTTLSDDERENVAIAFREMLLNAIEHGGLFDPYQEVNVTYFRTNKAIIYLIQDPGQGFSFDRLPHAAISNPAHSPAAHIEYRAQHGLRAGGFGILIARKLVDEALYNEKGNEVLLIKYLSF
ncbi:MAG: ATP-binding protein [Bryobacteraceae bacterium]